MAEGLVETKISQQLRKALREFFGFDRFKGQQEAIIESICEGQDTFVIMPTGANPFVTNYPRSYLPEQPSSSRRL